MIQFTLFEFLGYTFIIIFIGVALQWAISKLNEVLKKRNKFIGYCGETFEKDNEYCIDCPDYESCIIKKDKL